MSQENQIEKENKVQAEMEKQEQEAREKREEFLAKQAAILFVHGLDKRVDEGMIYRLFNNYNVSYIKLAKEEKTGISLGYAFVGFGNREKAGQALQEVNYSRIMNKTVRLAWYDRTANNARKKPENNVFVKNIPRNVSSKEFHEFYSQFGKILAAKIAEDEEGDSLGYGYVLYEDANCAKKAIEETHGKPWKDTKMKLYVCQLERKRPRKPLRFNNLYVRNIPKDWDVEQLKKYFSKYGEISSAIVRSPKRERVDKKTPECISSNIFVHQYGFVCFKSIDGPAEKAVIKVPYLKLNDEAYNKQVEEQAEVFRGLGIKDEDVYKCTCYVHEYKLKDKMKSEEGLAEIKKSFLELMDFYDGHYVVRNVEDRLHCCRAMKKKEREKLLRFICERLKRKVRARYKFCNLYVKHLPDDFDKEKLVQMFAQFGPIRSARILRSEASDPKFKFIKRKTRVFAYVCYFDPETAKQAKKKLNGKVYIRNGPRLFVDYHQTKKERLEFLKLKMMKKYEKDPYKYMVEPYMKPIQQGKVPPAYGQFIYDNVTPLTNPPVPITLIPGQGGLTNIKPNDENVPMVQLLTNNQIEKLKEQAKINPNAQIIPGMPSSLIIPGLPYPQIIPGMPYPQILPILPNNQTGPQSANVPVNTNIQMTQPANANVPKEQLVDNNSQVDLGMENDENIFNKIIPFEHPNEQKKNIPQYNEPEELNILHPTNTYKKDTKDINESDKLYSKLLENEKYSKYQNLFPKIVKLMLRLKKNDIQLLCADNDLFVHHMDKIIPVVVKEAEREAKIRENKLEEEKRKLEEEREADLWKVGIERHYEGEEEDIMTEEEQKKYELDLTKDIDWEKIFGDSSILGEDEK